MEQYIQVNDTIPYKPFNLNIILISGHAGTGKSTTADLFEKFFKHKKKISKR